MDDEEANESGVGWDEALGEHASNPPQQRLTGERLFALDQEWLVSPDEGRIKAQFEDWLKARGQQAIYETLRSGDFDEAERQRAAFIGSRAAGAYTWDGKINRAARGDKPGICYLLYLMMRRCQQPNKQEVTEELVGQIAENNWVGVIQTVALALGNWKSPAKKIQSTQPQPPKQPPLNKREIRGETQGSAWTGETTRIPSQVIPPGQMSDAATLAQQYSDADILRAMQYLRSKKPATTADDQNRG